MTVIQPLWLREEDVPELPDGWIALTTNEACEQLKPGKLYSGKTTFESGDIPVLSQGESGLVGYHNDAPGVVASRNNPVVTFANHTCAMRLMTHPYSCIQNIFSKVGKDGVCDTRYFYYAAMGRVTIGDYKGHHPLFRQAYIPIPPMGVQHKIVSVLSTYDDLIENNTRRIEILEEMARRLYEEWFVHFRFPGHEEVSFKESELGRIPEGWEVQELGDVSQINPEAIKPKSAPDEIHYIDIASVSPGQIDKAETMQFANAPGRARRIVRSGDVLWSCVRPNRRSCAMIVEPRENTVASTGFAVLRAGSISKHYLYQYVRADQFVSYLVNRATGAAYPAVKAADFKEAKIIVPQIDILSDFDKAVAPMRNLIHRLDRKNANLRAQRDLLLPKLVSGEIDVSDITMPEDKEVEAA